MQFESTNTVDDIQDKLEKLYDPQARRLLYVLLKKAKHEQNETNRLSTSTSKTVKLFRSEKCNLLYKKYSEQSATNEPLPLPSPTEFHLAHEDGANFINIQELLDGSFKNQTDVCFTDTDYIVVTQVTTIR